MGNIYSDGPIIACSTGRSSNTAIGLIRISGFKDIKIFDQSFSVDLTTIVPRSTVLCDLYDNSKVLDNIVLVYYKGPSSYNGENILELSVHGNQINIENIINLFVSKYSLRIAREGEFTYRALINKKLSLSQVEGLDLLLNANSSLTFSNGMSSLQGKLQDEYSKLRDSYLMLKGCIELSIDFSDDMGDEQANALLNKHISDFDTKISILKHRVSSDLDSLTNPDIVLVGHTNAGKSSLFNSLLKVNRSIVSNIAGTTRDYISQTLMIDGTRFQLIDTAGIRETKDEIEVLGIRRAVDVLKKSFFKILVVNPFDVKDFTDYDLLQSYTFDLIIFTHSDIESEINLVSLCDKLPKSRKYINLSLIKDGPIEPLHPFSKESGSIEPENMKKAGPIEPAINHKSGPIEPPKNKEVVSYLNEYVSSKYKKLHDDEPVLIDRQRESINKLYLMWSEFQLVLESENDISIISSEISNLDSYVGELVGIISSDDVLNNLFANFCIGK